ncbi:hypothetical protein CAEBREN_22563 [Caenorhabditis brenneri]|uniref:Uncharacterized protein n=1 Tax=Caenorhabditis brenneri TaxID=135651 RepID=G0P572_CAEBE|nr:hypothetical protein CAEBREN_22563 [Caenorhabditis brenneri]
MPSTTEPMEEDDSFNNPVPRAVPLNRNLPYSQLTQAPPLLMTKPPGKDESDVESDDSFETFAPTQTTGGGSIKSSASSTQSTENKQYPPTLQRTQCSHHPSAPQPFQMTQRPSVPSTVTLQPAFRPQSKTGLHLAVSNTKTGDFRLTQRPPAAAASSSSSSSSNQNSQGGGAGGPDSPNSLARHRSANSGLRNSPFHPPGFRANGPAGIFGPRPAPPVADSQQRPVTPSGEVQMLRDQLESEKRKYMRFQSQYQNDNQKRDEDHQRALSAKDILIEKQKKEIEMLKSINACRPTTSGSAPTPPTMAPPTFGPGVPSAQNIKKVQPKIPSADAKMKTPRRTPLRSGPISAFRHPFKEETDDTFEMNISFQPMVTSTPKVALMPRTGLRRALELNGADENARGAPTPKKKAIFKEQRKKRTQKELDEVILKIQKELDPEFEVFEAPEPKIEKNPASDDLEQWIDRNLTRKLKFLEFRKAHEKMRPNEKSKSKNDRMRLRIQKRAEVPPEIKKLCGMCEQNLNLAPDRNSNFAPNSKKAPSLKEWQKKEERQVEIAKKQAEELKNLHYSQMQQVLRKGLDEFKGIRKKNQEVEEQYQRRVAEIKPRSLEELREKKRIEWTEELMRRLNETGEFSTNLEIRDGGSNDDYIWTDDEEEGEQYHYWMFPKFGGIKFFSL